MKAARREERRVAEAEDLGEEHEQQQPAEQARDAHVGDRPDVRVAASSLPGATRAERDPVKQRVQRQQHEVVRDDRDQEPREDLHHRRSREAVKPAGDRRPRDQQARGEREQVQRARTVQAAKPGEHGYARSNVIVPAHLVQWTPGIAGPITRAG